MKLELIFNEFEIRELVSISELLQIILSFFRAMTK